MFNGCEISVAAATRDALDRREGPLHPDDLAALRQGGAIALFRRRAWDRAALLEAQLQAALEAVRARHGRHASRTVPGPQARLRRLRALALASRDAADAELALPAATA